MDSFDVVISPKALAQLDSYIDYIQHTLLNPQAAERVWRDALATRAQLSTVAGSLALCKNPALHDLGYRCIAFQSHRYAMLYRVVNTTAYVDAVYHMQQDYENIWASEINTPN
jgi:plasmid stabilization system protein ParE